MGVGEVWRVALRAQGWEAEEPAGQWSPLTLVGQVGSCCMDPQGGAGDSCGDGWECGEQMWAS